MLCAVLFYRPGREEGALKLLISLHPCKAINITLCVLITIPYIEGMATIAFYTIANPRLVVINKS